MIDRFWSHVDRRGPDECWPWTGCCNAKGYGRFRVSQDEGVKLAHRVAWELAFGPIPPGKMVLHRCDNPPCCNLACLFLGTAADNSRDMVRKGRSPRSRGDRNGKVKVTDDALAAILERHHKGEPLSALAAECGMSTDSLRNIVHGWRRGGHTRPARERGLLR